MKKHISAKSSHYNQQAKHYDVFNQDNWTKALNQTVEKILKKYKVKSIVDLTCGTGSQVFWLAKKGYEIVGSDFNEKMLSIARQKAKISRLKIKLVKGDVRNVQLGQFDAAITLANAIGHLTKSDFAKALQNIHSNLKPKGLYLFDINNLAYLLKSNNITTLTIDWFKTLGRATVRDIQYSTINPEGILASYTTSYVQKNSKEFKKVSNSQTLQIYTAQQLKMILKQQGFKVLNQYGIDGSKFNNFKTPTILTVAQRID